MGQGACNCAPLIHDSKDTIDEKFKNALQTQNEALIKQLVEEHTALNLLDTIFPDGNGVLHIAVNQQNLNLIQYFLSNGLSTNQQNPITGDTPLHVASRLTNFEIVSLLTKYDADTNISNCNNETPTSIVSNFLGDCYLIAKALSTAAPNANKQNAIDEDTEFVVTDMEPNMRRARARTRTQSLLSVAKITEPMSMSTMDEDSECTCADTNTQTFSRSEVGKHTSLDTGIWIIIGDIVYDITLFIKCNLHPATNAFIEPYYGRDATEPFDATFHSLEAVRLINKYEIGRVKAEEQRQTQRHRDISVQKGFNAVLSDTGSFRSRLRVSQMFIFPVKGMKGIAVEKAELTPTGFVDDRIYAVVNKATEKVVNQLTYPRLSQIHVAFKDGSSNCDAGIQLNGELFVPFIKNKTLSVEWKSCTTKFLVYDQGEVVSKWITAFLNNDDHQSLQEEEFILVRIHEENYRESEEYFALSFAPKEVQKLSGFQNYCAVNLASEESMTELNRRYRAKRGDDENEIGWDRFRENIVISGVFMAHHEDFMKHITFGDVLQESDRAEILWSRRRYFCAVPQVDQMTSMNTLEPIATARSYRNAITLNDRTAFPADDAVFFGSLFCVKHSGMVYVGQKVISEHEKLDYDAGRTAFDKSYFGLTEHNIGPQFEINYLAQYEEFELLSKEEYNHDTIKVRFGMVVKSHHVFRKSLQESLQMGDHYLLKYVDVNDEAPIIRAYTPLFDDEAKDNNNNNKMSFVLVVKLYPNGRMTQHLNRMKIGDTISCKQSAGKVCYFEIGSIRFGDPRISMHAPYTLKVNKFNLIAAGSGITPMYQIIANIHSKKEFDETQISLIYANKSEKDILLRDELEEIQRVNANIKIHFIIEENTEAETAENTFDIGRINLDICQKYLFPPIIAMGGKDTAHSNKRMVKIRSASYDTDDEVSSETKPLQTREKNEPNKEQKGENNNNFRVVTLLCGPHPMVQAVKRCLTQIGYDDKSVATF